MVAGNNRGRFWQKKKGLRCYRIRQCRQLSQETRLDPDNKTEMRHNIHLNTYLNTNFDYNLI
jgi:hypothetical protein